MINCLKNSIIAAYLSSFCLGLVNLGNPHLALIVFALNFILTLILIIVCAKQRNSYDVESQHLFNVTRLLISSLMCQALIFLMMVLCFGVYNAMKNYGVQDNNLDMFNLIVGKLTLLYFVIFNAWCLCFRSGLGLYRFFNSSNAGC